MAEEAPDAASGTDTESDSDSDADAPQDCLHRHHIALYTIAGMLALGLSALWTVAHRGQEAGSVVHGEGPPVTDPYHSGALVASQGTQQAEGLPPLAQVGLPAIESEAPEIAKEEHMEPMGGVPQQSTNGSLTNGSLTKVLTVAVPWERVTESMVKRGRSPYDRYALDCWDSCHGAGMCEEWCGVGKACCRKGNQTDPKECSTVGFWPVTTYHTCVFASILHVLSDGESASEELSTATVLPSVFPPSPIVAPSPAPMLLPEAPTFQFYVYRARSGAATYPFGSVNAANVPGVLWYLENEVRNMHRCPMRYGIDRINRYIVTTKATPELYQRGMNFGVRYSFDHGECTGSNVRYLGPCKWSFARYGHIVGCNNFRDHYPWPQTDTEYPDGVWYSFPSEGKCSTPNGGWNCTWSVEDAGEVLISELEELRPGKGFCCNGNCTDFWTGHLRHIPCQRRLADVMLKFAQKYPNHPVDMPAPRCDFDHENYWD